MRTVLQSGMGSFGCRLVSLSCERLYPTLCCEDNYLPVSIVMQERGHAGRHLFEPDQPGRASSRPVAPAWHYRPALRNPPGRIGSPGRIRSPGGSALQGLRRLADDETCATPPVASRMGDSSGHRRLPGDDSCRRRADRLGGAAFAPRRARFVDHGATSVTTMSSVTTMTSKSTTGRRP